MSPVPYVPVGITVSSDDSADSSGVSQGTSEAIADFFVVLGNPVQSGLSE